MIDAAYERGRCNRTTDYTQPGSPPLPQQEEVWASELLKTAVKR